jgi:hypothetical protein
MMLARQRSDARLASWPCRKSAKQGSPWGVSRFRDTRQAASAIEIVDTTRAVHGLVGLADSMQRGCIATQHRENNAMHTYEAHQAARPMDTPKAWGRWDFRAVWAWSDNWVLGTFTIPDYGMIWLILGPLRFRFMWPVRSDHGGEQRAWTLLG